MLNKRFTFSSKAMYGKSIPLFVLVILSCYSLSFSMSKLVAGFIFVHYPNEVAVLLGTCLYTMMNYLGQKYIVFS